MAKLVGPLPIKAIVKFFAFSLIILGIIFIADGAYFLFSFDDSNKMVIDDTVPVIQFAKDGNNAIISITHNKGIARIKYNWNDETETLVRGNSEREIVISDGLSIPSGTNILNVTATDDNGKSSSASYEYTYDGIAIDLSVVNNSDIKIVASDVTGMKSMTYKWNSEKEVIVYPNEEGGTSIEQSIEIPSGLNTLYITAVNSSNITLTKKQEIKGNKRPEIELYIIDSVLHVTVRDEEGVDKVTQQVNLEEEEVFDGRGLKEFSYTWDVGDEDILVTITATDVEGVSRTIKGKNY